MDLSTFKVKASVLKWTTIWILDTYFVARLTVVVSFYIGAAGLGATDISRACELSGRCHFVTQPVYNHWRDRTSRRREENRPSTTTSFYGIIRGLLFVNNVMYTLILQGVQLTKFTHLLPRVLSALFFKLEWQTRIVRSMDIYFPRGRNSPPPPLPANLEQTTFDTSN